MNNSRVSYLKGDFRPAFVIVSASNAQLVNVNALRAQGASIFDLRNVDNFNAHQCDGVPDMHLERVEQEVF
jgi:hypothetical protein